MVDATSKARIECDSCAGTTNVEAKEIGLKGKYNHCPLCGSEDIDAMYRK